MNRLIQLRDVVNRHNAEKCFRWPTILSDEDCFQSFPSTQRIIERSQSIGHSRCSRKKGMGRRDPLDVSSHQQWALLPRVPRHPPNGSPTIERWVSSVSSPKYFVRHKLEAEKNTPSCIFLTERPKGSVGQHRSTGFAASEMRDGGERSSFRIAMICSTASAVGSAKGLSRRY